MGELMDSITVYYLFIMSTDIDECLSSPCHSNAMCNNTAGGFTCSCNYGYTGDGVGSCCKLIII